MKKVGFFLATISVFGVFGGALAYKANFDLNVFIHDPNDARVFACTKQIFAATLTPNPSPMTATRASIASTTAACPIVTVYKGE